MNSLVLKFLTFLTLSITVNAEVWKITTLEWPPFSCEKCADGGAAIKGLKTALKSVGVDAEFVFLPWSRAIAQGKEEGYIGYYPAWPEDVIEGFKPSDVLFHSPVGLMEPKNKPLGNFASLSELKGKTIGVVQDYGNTPEFNKLAKDGVYEAAVVTSDEINFKLVASNRVDAAFIDANNFKYFAKIDSANGSKVQMNPKVLANKSLHIAIKDNIEASKKEKLQKALKSVNIDKIVEDYIAKNL